MADRRPLVFLSDNSVGELPSSDSLAWSWLSNVPAFASRWPAWGEVTGKPINYPTTWSMVADKPSAFPSTWGNIAGSIVDQADLQHALNVVILDAGFEEMTGWGSSPTNNTLPTGARYVFSTSTAVRSGERSLGMMADTIVYNTRMAPAATGDRFALRLWARSLSSAVPSAGSGMEIGMRAYDASGTFITGSNASYVVVTSPGSNFGWTVGNAEYVAPAGTVYVSAYLRTRADTGAGEWLVDDVRVERIGATMESVLDRYSLAVSAGGDVAGMQLLAGGPVEPLVFTGLTSSGTVSDSAGDVRKLRFTTSNAGTTLAAAHLNGVVEKSNTTAYIYTIPSGLGSQGDAITFVNSGTGGNLTISRATGVSLYRNGTNDNIVVGPGSMVTVYRSATANRWIA